MPVRVWMPEGLRLLLGESLAFFFSLASDTGGATQ
jgi:hypothetical protein